ncbi:hypothetical protein FBUS_11664, partial [Fasciolopsis buskii]
DDGTPTKLVHNLTFLGDLDCLRTILGPSEPYIVILPFDPSTSATGLSEDAKSNVYNYSRFGSTRIDVSQWVNDDFLDHAVYPTNSPIFFLYNQFCLRVSNQWAVNWPSRMKYKRLL